MLRKYKILLIVLVMTQLGYSTLFAEDFYLDSPYNKGTLRFELDNDIVWDVDSNFTNGWSLQYHTVRYANRDKGRHLPKNKKQKRGVLCYPRRK